MDIRHCEYCEQIYSAPKEGAASMLCRKCMMDCNEAYLKVRRFITENRNASLEDAATATDVPQIFIEAMLLDGRFEVHHEIRLDENSTEEMRRRKQILDDIQGVREQLSEASPPSSPSSPSSSSPQKKRRYGLGR